MYTQRELTNKSQEQFCFFLSVLRSQIDHVFEKQFFWWAKVKINKLTPWEFQVFKDAFNDKTNLGATSKDVNCMFLLLLLMMMMMVVEMVMMVMVMMMMLMLTMMMVMAMVMMMF